MEPTFDLKKEAERVFNLILVEEEWVGGKV